MDDFHDIPRDVQTDIGKEIKEAAEARRSDFDRVGAGPIRRRVRRNNEFVAVTNIDMTYRKDAELEQIGYLGLRELNVDIAPDVIRRLTREALGSPQLMQQSLDPLPRTRHAETRPAHERVPVDDAIINARP